MGNDKDKVPFLWKTWEDEEFGTSVCVILPYDGCVLDIISQGLFQHPLVTYTLATHLTAISAVAEEANDQPRGALALALVAVCCLLLLFN